MVFLRTVYGGSIFTIKVGLWKHWCRRGGWKLSKTPKKLIHGIARQLKEGAENQAGKRAYALVAQEGETALNQTLKALQPFLDGLDKE